MPKPAKRTTKTKPQNWGITGSSTIRRLTESNMFDVLSGAQLVVYLRLLAAVYVGGSHVVNLTNMELHKNRMGKTAKIALDELEAMGLIKLTNHGAGFRDIKVF